MSESPQPAARWSRADRVACLVCAAMGLVLAVAPHLAVLARRGTLEYVADGDDVLYLAISRIPYHGEPALRDPFSARREGVPTLYAWLQFVPTAVLTRLVGLHPVLTGLVWRALGGPLLGLSLFVLFRRLLAGTRSPTAWALGCAVVCLADAGFVGGRLLVQDLGLLAHMARGTTPMGKPDALAHLRVVTPLLNLPWLLLLVAVLLPGGGRGWREWALGAVCLGLCFQLYFFFWTAAVVGVGGYLASRGLALAAGRDRDEEGWSGVRFGAAVLAGGMVLGAPQVYSNARTFADPHYKPILRRMDRGKPLPPGDPQRAKYLKNAWALGRLAAGGALIVGLGFWRAGLLWWMTLAGYLLANSALVTGLEFENFHWSYVYNPLGEVMLLGLAALALDRWGPRRWLPSLWALPVGLGLIALAWRPYEALHAPEAAFDSRLLEELRPLRPALSRLDPEDTLAGPYEANFALLFTRAGQLYQQDQTWVSSPIPTEEVNQRHALNSWLRGLDLARYRKVARPRIPPVPDADVEARVAVFRQLLDGSSRDLVGRFRPTALLLPAGDPAPDRAGPWRLDAATPQWNLWIRQGSHGELRVP
jgi:hypothetical protein